MTANDIENIPVPILDRVEVININSYTLFEKKDIACNYILPKIFKEYGKDIKVKISDELVYFIINNYTKEAGVRELERVLSSLVRKSIINGYSSLSKEKVIKLLGKEKYSILDSSSYDIGTVNSLAYTPLGGVVTQTEVIAYKGSGKIIITGNAGDILEESVEVAISFIKNNYKETISNLDLHIHFLEASMKKDGPSAGLPVTVAILSFLKKKKISKDMAFTGEISLNGDILKVGGLKEKLIGAYNKGVKVVYIPTSNKDDLVNIPKIIKENVDIIPINNFKELWTKLFK